MQNYTLLVSLAFAAYVPFVLALFAMLPPRRAVLVATITAVLFLPNAVFRFPHVPDLTKSAMISWGLIWGIAIFDWARLSKLRPTWMDAPASLLCLSPFATAIANGLGPYEGLSAVLAQVLTWGVPYVAGRLYFNDVEGLRELAAAVVIAGLIYTPLCLWESRFGAQMHRMVYGFNQQKFYKTFRFGGFRPMVFMNSGLMLGLWMSAATLLALWLWNTRSLAHSRSVLRNWMGPATMVLVVGAIACRATGATLLLFTGVGTLVSIRLFRTALPVVAVVLAVFLYIGLRASNLWTGQQLVGFAERYVSPERAQSLQFRLDNEDALAEKAMERPLLGWGRFDRLRIYNPDGDLKGRKRTIPDGLWIITLGQNGFVGLAALLSFLVLPVLVLIRRYPAPLWVTPGLAPVAMFAVLIALFTVDALFNAFPNQVYTQAVGGLSGFLAVSSRPPAPRPVLAQAALAAWPIRAR